MRFNIFSIVTLLFSFGTITSMADECHVLVLSGGGSHGAFEASAVSEIAKTIEYDWDVVTGVSAGSLNALYISTIPKGSIKEYTDTFESIWTGIKNKDIYSWNLFFNEVSLFSTNPLHDTIHHVFQGREIQRKLLVGTANLSQLKAQVFDESDFNQNSELNLNYIMASTAIPFAFPPYHMDNEWFIDGGITGNVLIWEGIERCQDNDIITVDIVLCTPLETPSSPLPDRLTLFQLLKPMYGMVMNQLEYSDLIHHQF